MGIFGIVPDLCQSAALAHSVVGVTISDSSGEGRRDPETSFEQTETNISYRLLAADTVEKLCFSAARKLL